MQQANSQHHYSREVSIPFERPSRLSVPFAGLALAVAAAATAASFLAGIAVGTSDAAHQPDRGLSVRAAPAPVSARRAAPADDYYVYLVSSEENRAFLEGALGSIRRAPAQTSIDSSRIYLVTDAASEAAAWSFVLETNWFRRGIGLADIRLSDLRAR